MAQPVTVKERPGGVYTNDVITPRHHLYADEPTSFGSADIGPSPFEYLCAALGACTTITMRMYINRKGWEVDHLAVDVSHKRVSSGEGPARDVFTRGGSLTGLVIVTVNALDVADYRFVNALSMSGCHCRLAVSKVENAPAKSQTHQL